MIIVPDPGDDASDTPPPGGIDPWDDLQQQTARQIIGQREEYAKAALGILQAWVGFLMVVILSQIALRAIGIGTLHDGEFIATITSTTASIIAFTFIVARYLFPEGGSQDGLKYKK